MSQPEHNLQKEERTKYTGYYLVLCQWGHCGGLWYSDSATVVADTPSD